MRLTDVTVLPFAPASGGTAGAVGVVLLVEAEGGLRGIGASSHTPAAASAALEVLRPMLVGVDFDSPEQAQVALSRSLPPSSEAMMLLGAIDAALWDIWACQLKVPVSVALGGRHRERVRAAIRISADALGAVAEFATAGCTSFVIEGRPSARQLHDLRSAAGETALLAIACSGALRRHEATALANRARDAGAWLLDPLPVSDVDGYAILRSTSHVPVLAGATGTATELLRLLEVPSIDGLVLDLGRLGGLTSARAVIWAAEDAGSSILIRGSDEPHALAADLHLMSAASFDGIVSVDPLGTSVVGADGRLAVPDGAGLGTADPSEIASSSVASSLERNS